MLVATIFGLLLLATGIWLFNRLVRMRNQVHAAWSDIDVQLQRRHDLIPVLVNTVRGYTRHESDLLERVTRERAQACNTRKIAERGEKETLLGQDLDRLIALGEAYPDLKASNNFQQLSAQLVEIEDALQHARRFYNGSVRQYNTATQRFPTLLVAAIGGFRAADFFAAQSDARSAVNINLDTSHSP